METQKIVNLWNSSENEYSKFATKTWCVIDSESKAVYLHQNPTQFLTSSLESGLCDYSDAHVLVRGNIVVVGANNYTKDAFKNCAPFRKCRTEINETLIDEALIFISIYIYINIAMPMYNLIGSLWQFKRDTIEGDFDLTADGNHIPNNSSSFKYKSSLITNWNGVKIAVPLKYLSNLSRSFELSLSWDPNCVLCSLVGASTFTIADAKLYLPFVTLSNEYNIKLS